MESDLTQESIQREVAAIRHDLMILSAGTTLLYIGIGCREDIQRALADSQALQLTVRGLFLLSRLISSVLLPPMFINRLGTKTALLIAYLLHAFYLLTNLDPRFSNLIPGAGILGASNAVLWSAIGIYITRLAAAFVVCRGVVKGQPPETALVKFLALFFCLLNSSYAVNSLIASFVLNPSSPGMISDDQASKCGVDYCNDILHVQTECNSLKKTSSSIPRTAFLSEDKNVSDILSISSTLFPTLQSTTHSVSIIRNSPPDSSSRVLSSVTSSLSLTTTQVPLCDEPLFHPPPANQVYIVGGIFVALAFIGFIVIGVSLRSLITSPLQPPPPHKQAEPSPTTAPSNSILYQMGETFEVLRDNSPMILLSLVAFCYGHIDNFFVFDFPKAYILCIVGHHYAGFVTFCMGILASICAFALLWVHVSFNRLWLILVSTVLGFICILSLFVWKPSADSKGVAFFLSLLWGVVKALWNIQIFGLCGMLGFPRLAAAFSNLIFWWTTGQVISFFWAELICINHKLYVLAVIMAVATVASVAIELWLRPPATLSRIAPSKTSMGRPPNGDPSAPPPLNTISRTVSSQPTYEHFRTKAESAPTAPSPPSPIISVPSSAVPSANSIMSSEVLPEEVMSKSLVLRSDMTVSHPSMP